MYPTNWMTEETFKVSHNDSLAEVARIRGNLAFEGMGEGEALIPPP